MTDPQAGVTPPPNPNAAAASGAPGAPQYGAPQHNPYAATRPVRPPLTPRARAGALIAGAVAMLMVSIGGPLIGIPLLLLFIGLLFATIATSIGGEAQNVLDEVLSFVPTELLVGVGVVLVLLGIALIVGALFVSRGILRSRGHDKAWPITWAGLGIAVVAGSTVSGLLSLPLQFATQAVPSFGGSGEIEAGLGLLVIGVNAVVTAAVGALSWWWMAHVMRPAGHAPADPAQPTA
ncbi:hypothetical protein [Microcella flavibacter]|uniref:hypothetical protein n=1 Tax=Microcella flavibacter TaxID=1804990 RepID=UPI00145672C7|nr:hypothetical protein [Microcella flavibacter]